MSDALTVTPFAFEGEDVRTVIGDDGEPWFILADVCFVLGIGNARDAAGRLDADEKADVGIVDASSNGVEQRRTMNIVNEAGLYRLIFTSRKPAAERFKRWLAHDVLPVLRRTGRYDMADNMPAAGERSQGVVDLDLPDLTPRELNALSTFLSAVHRIFGRRAAAEMHAEWKALLATATVVELNSWSAYLHRVEQLGGRAQAMTAYGKTGLPRVASMRLPDGAGPVLDELDGIACLRHIFAQKATPRRRILVAAHVQAAMRGDRGTRLTLGHSGLYIEPENWKGFMAVAMAHPSLDRLLACTVWAPDWVTPLLGIKGARRTTNAIAFPDRQRRAVLVPLEAVEEALAPEPAQEAAE